MISFLILTLTLYVSNKLLITVTRGAGAQRITVKSTGYGFGLCMAFGAFCMKITE